MYALEKKCLSFLTNVRGTFRLTTTAEKTNTIYNFWSALVSAQMFLRNTDNEIFGPKREVDGSWRKIHNDKLHNLYSSPNIVMVIKSMRLRWAGHVARMGRGEIFTGLWWESPKGRDHWEDLGVGVRITLSWTLGRQGSMGRTGFGWLRIGSNGWFL
jgi:hypothetical protein